MNQFSGMGPDGPPAWSLMLGDAGRYLIIGGAFLFVLSALLWVMLVGREHLIKWARATFVLGCASLAATFGILATLFINNRWEYEYVWGHGDSKNTLPYQIAGIWAGQEGSFLLWALCAAGFGLLAIRMTGLYERWFGFAYSLFLGTLCGILAYESPFVLNPSMPADGVGLSPALQNYWVVIHPPVIFFGFGALTIPAALALAAMLTKNYNDWIPIVRPWSILALTLTGLGLCLGGFWAYETLGWGGFWMWDPVENTSFVPWVLMAASIHGMLVQTTKKRWHISNLLLATLPFIAFVYGTFLTRSGMLSETSVHSFAEMDNNALKLLLGFFGGSSLTFLGLWAYRAYEAAKGTEEPEPVPGFTKEGFYRFGIILLVFMGVATAIGMSVPMIMSVTGKQQKVVEENLYHSVLTWLFVPLMLVLAIGPMMSWRTMGVRDLLKRLYGVICATFGLVGLTMFGIAQAGWMPAADARIQLPYNLQVPTMPWVLMLVAICYFAGVASLWRATELLRGSKLALGSYLAHVGLAILMIGLIVSRTLEQKDQVVVQEGGHNVGLGYFIAFKGMTKDVMDRENEVLFDVQRKQEKFEASPGFYYSQGGDGKLNPMVWPHIERHPLYDIYFTLHPPQTEASDPVPLKIGETKQMGNWKATYVSPIREGEMGADGTKFGAKIKLDTGGREIVVSPTLELHNHGIVNNDVPVGKEYLVSIKDIDAATQTVTLLVKYSKPIYPVELFFKPMTILVWIGTGLLTLAGFMVAAYTWPRKKKTPPAESPKPKKEPKAKKKDKELVGSK